jgi:endonuclease III
VSKKPFDTEIVFNRIRDAVADFPKAALFELAEDGFDTPFELLIACIISIRTRDEATLPISRKLFSKARTPEQISKLTPAEIDKIIGQTTFHERKAVQIHKIAKRVVEEHNGDLPCDPELLLSFEGVGPKCANLVLGIACGELRVGVDIHVHRVTNRWGLIQTKTPEKSISALESKLPQKYWVEINRLLVPFGKNICTGSLPKCSTCPVLDMCQQVGVDSHR